MFGTSKMLFSAETVWGKEKEKRKIENKDREINRN